MSREICFYGGAAGHSQSTFHFRRGGDEGELSGDFLPKHMLSILQRATQKARSRDDVFLYVSFECDSSSEEW